ncbi:iron-containing redox enzyme family protein [Streptomyces sp. SID13726]|uniref:iron-containing redox enzyme family protein n=1 Tax=Streptomyces sp. SID13726 TaxID=2706058 RepID=UPI0013BCA4EB|nr:iron-containing redox enzyme family protein [Streptomyces sp. SID13726]NEB00237.1 iron-containing redox enzyme family protein [Streptomyces sp. SID13726]
MSSLANRVINVGYDNRRPFLNAAASAELRAEIDVQIDRQIADWYETVPAAAHLEGKDVDSEYYKRNLIETAWRIRLLRVAESKALTEIAKRSPEAAQVWANYEQEEMLHDELFIDDLAKVGVSREDFLAVEPYLSTKLLTGYFSYLLDHEGPLGVVAYSYLVEYVNVKLEPKKLVALKESVGEGNIGGQISHSHTDINDDHPGEVWAALRFLIRGEQDIEALKRYLAEHQRLLAQYFEELYADTLGATEKAAA